MVSNPSSCPVLRLIYFSIQDDRVVRIHQSWAELAEGEGLRVGEGGSRAWRPAAM